MPPPPSPAHCRPWLSTVISLGTRALGAGLFSQTLMWLLMRRQWWLSTPESTGLRGRLLTMIHSEEPFWSPPPVQYLPSTEKPFVFLHLRKSAGSTMREFIVQSALERGLQVLVPCYTSDCRTYYGDGDYHRMKSPGVSVIAGHFSWGVISSHVRATSFDRLAHYPSASERHDNQFSCFTVLRDPVSRFMSCYYYRSAEWQERIGTAPYTKPAPSLSGRTNVTDITSFSVDEWRVVVRDFYDFFGFGCNNEGIRIFSGLVDEPTVNTLTDQVVEGRAVLQRSKARLSKCVVGLVEDMNTTFRAVDYWFPWLPANRWRADTKQNRHKYTSKAKALPAEYVQVIKEANMLDTELYKYAKEVLIPKQVAHMAAHPRTRAPTTAPTVAPTASPTVSPTPSPTAAPTPVPAAEAES